MGMKRNLRNSSHEEMEKDICEMMRGNPTAIQYVYDFLYVFTEREADED